MDHERPEGHPTGHRRTRRERIRRERIRRRRTWRWTGPALAVVMAAAGWSLAAPPAAAVPSGWVIVPSANTGAADTNLLLRDTCANAWDCWAVGAGIASLADPGAQPQALIDHWNGRTWSVASSGGPAGAEASLLYDVACVTPGDCWSVGGVQRGSSDAAPAGLTDHWDGSTWKTVANPLAAGLLTSVTCVSSTDCWATGGTSESGDNALPVAGILLHWDGSSWTAAHLPATGEAFSELNGVSCPSASSCWAVGGDGPNQASSGLLPGVLPRAVGDRALVEHWDGTRWSITAVPQAAAPDGAYLAGVTCPSAAVCFAVGTVMDAAGNPGAALADRWDGARWSSVPVPQPTAGESLLNQVACLGPGACWAVGVAGFVPGGNSSPAPLVDAWNGTAWSVEPSPDATALAELGGVTCLPGTGCVATGFTGVNLGDNLVLHSLVEQLTLPPAGSQGALLAAADGGVFSFGTARFSGSLGAVRLNRPVVGMAATPDGRGYWLAAADGGVFSFGTARFSGSLGAVRLNRPVVGMAATPDGRGYWLAAADGGVFSFGTARFSGSLGAVRLNRPVVGMAATPDGRGYWLAAADGGVFSFGDAAFYGSTGAMSLTAPVVSMAATPDGHGYWLAAADGGVFSFGDAAFYGSVPGQGITTHPPVVGVSATPDGGGYWLVDRDGGVYAYGDAAFLGSLTGHRLDAPVVGIAASAP